MTTAVLGAAGFLGVNLVDALVAQGERPRCVRRPRTNVLALRQRKVPMVTADAERPDELREALLGADTVFHLAGHYPRHCLEPALSLETGLRQLRHVLDAAAAAGVKRLVYVSSTATVAPAAGRPSTEADVFQQAPPYGLYHALKWQMEQLALAERRFEVVVACPAACLGPHDLRVGTSALLVALARGLDPPHPDGWVSWVDARDVAAALVRLARAAAPPRRVILSAGTVGLHPLLLALARRYSVAPPSPPLPAAKAIALADAEEARARVDGDRARLSREIADLIVWGVELDATLARTSLGVVFRPLDETLDAFDAWARRVGTLPPHPKGAPWKHPPISTHASSS
ncbi:MAG: NAD-dependent epimerase/dehydratase family protein [Archangiaceae bacterium]|nr:NAD-dependent epimerase/dehydratase family protein [Archangiaceae bacterium]